MKIFSKIALAALVALPMHINAANRDTTFVANGNPIVKYKHVGDPAAMVHNGTLYIYGGVDEAPEPEQRYVMNQWAVFSTKDMKTFTEHPCPLRTTDFKWCRGDAWAAQVIERDGKFYWYVTVEGPADQPGKCLAVAVSDSPVGPFHDALGKPLVTHQMTGSPRPNMWWDDIDPTVFIDNGQAYIFWGNTNCYWAKLKDNMIELDGPIHKAQFVGNAVRQAEGTPAMWNGNTYLGATDPGENAGEAAGFKYTEAPWIHKRGDWFYLSFAIGWPEKLGYAMSKSIEGPWEFKGVLNELAGNSNTNHHGIFEFNGEWYIVYHNGALPDGCGYRRSICLDRIYYNPDGTMKRMVMTSEGVQ